MLNKQQALYWTNDGLLYWHIYVVLGLDVLTYAAYMDYMDLALRCPRKGRKFNHSLDVLTHKQLHPVATDGLVLKHQAISIYSADKILLWTSFTEKQCS